jgi:diguanylate cyclase (GGDEF)-like protein/PAS domain S-box-containing protein
MQDLFKLLLKWAAIFSRWRLLKIVILVILLVLSTYQVGLNQDNTYSQPMAVTAAIPRHFPPQYVLNEQGKPTGFAIDVMEQVAARAGLQVTYQVEETWDEVHKALASGRATLVPNMGITERRKAEFAFTSPVETFPVSIFVRDSEEKIRGLEDLAGHTVATFKTNVALDLLAGKPEVVLKVSDSPESALFYLLSGEADALVGPKPVLLNIARAVEVEGRLKVVGKPLMEIKRAIAVRRDNPALRDRLDLAVRDFVASPDYQKIYLKWYGIPHPYLLTRFLGGSLLLTLIGVIFWRHYSRRQLNRLEQAEKALQKANQELTTEIWQRRQVEKALQKTNQELERRVEERTEDLKLKNAELEAIFAIFPDLFFLVAADGTILDYRAQNMTELYVSPTIFLGKSMLEVLPAKVGQQFSRVIAQVLESQSLVSIEYSLPMSEEEEHYEARLIPFQDNQVIAIIRNISDRLQAEKAMLESERKFRAIFNQTFQLMSLLQPDGLLLEVNQTALDLIGLRREDVVGQLFWQTPWWTHSSYQQERLKGAMERAARGEFVRFEATHLNADRRLVMVDSSLKPVKDEWGKVVLLIAEARDITKYKQTEQALRKSKEQLRHDALHDPLTGLANRTLFIDRLNHCLKRSQRRKNNLFAVLFLDLDRFKVINESLGHLMGDRLLTTFAHRLQQCLRGNDTVARLGGDEFVILLEELQNQGEAMVVAERIHQLLNCSFNLGKQEVFVSVSIGIAFSSPTYNQPLQLLRDADTAMYYAKAAGKARHQVFIPSMYDQSLKQLCLENELRQALARQELVVYYQPIFCLKTNFLEGFEALVRWQHPERGLVSPDEFIPLAEETGLIVALDEWVMHSASSQLRLWHEQFPTLKPLSVSVNLSGKHFSQSDLIETIDRVITETGLEGKHLKLEITETVLIENPQVTTEMLEHLRERKIQVCLDDFGTGYSSLSYLHRFPLNILKIDRSFVSCLEEKVNNSAIVRTIASLAQELGLQLIAEGIETSEQRELLKGLGYHWGQGFWFSPPVDSKTMTILITRQFQRKNPS